MRDEKKRALNFIPHPSSLIPKLRRALRGDVKTRTLALEVLRRSRVVRERLRERAILENLTTRPAHLSAEFARLSPSELLDHFRNRLNPKFLPGCDALSHDSANLQRSLFPFETAQLLERATRIRDENCWRILGYGEKSFGARINWLRDPLSGVLWPLDYHADIKLARGDGSDARVLWEVNRLAHLITLARAFAVTGDEKFAESVFHHLTSWREQNPLGRGPNWACAMEVALRAMNLLAAFELLRRSAHLNERTLSLFLQTFDQHGAHIRRNLEFSYITTSNHYLSDVVGLLWLGVMLPELEAARSWREFGLRETLREMDKQVLLDGADSEASTGYHRLVLELFLYSFTLCRANRIEIEGKYWQKLRAMLDYVCAYLRPEGRAPLIGDTDSGQILPFVKRDADDHAYVLALGAALYDEPRFKQPVKEMPEELLWVLGVEGVRAFENLPLTKEGAESRAFKEAGTYILRHDDLYLLFNASGSGLSGRGSHGHNDALSVEVSACGTSFITDPGTYVYTADLNERHLFRSTAYHSTVEVDEEEQNTTNTLMPFVIGNEAQPRVTNWEIHAERDLVAAEHTGYTRLPLPVTHHRTVELHKRERYWTITDFLSVKASGHTYHFRFHFASGLEVSIRPDKIVRACDKIRGARLLIAPLWLNETAEPVLEENFTSRDYGARSPSRSACWTTKMKDWFRFDWMLIPVCAGEDEEARARLITERLAQMWEKARLYEEATLAKYRSPE